MGNSLEVYDFSKNCKISLNQIIRIYRYPQIITQTIQFILTRYLGFLETPKKYFFECLQYFTYDKDTLDKLKELCSFEGQFELFVYNHREHRTYSEVLKDFPTIHIPF